ERGLGRASGCNGAHEPDRHIFAFRPVCNIGLIGYARRDHACMRSRHSLSHGASQSPQDMLHLKDHDASGIGNVEEAAELPPLFLAYWEGLRLLAKPLELMKFTLIYDGDLPSSGNKSKTPDVCRIRN